MYNADIIYNYTLKYMILRHLSIDKIFKEMTVSECVNAKIFFFFFFFFFLQIQILFRYVLCYM